VGGPDGREEVPDLYGGSAPSAIGSELLLLMDTWHHLTRPRAGSGSGAVGAMRKEPDPWGPAALPLMAQLRMTTRVLSCCSRSGYPYYRVPTVAPGHTSGEVTNPQVGPLL